MLRKVGAVPRASSKEKIGVLVTLGVTAFCEGKPYRVEMLPVETGGSESATRSASMTGRGSLKRAHERTPRDSNKTPKKGKQRGPSYTKAAEDSKMELDTTGRLQQQCRQAALACGANRG